MTVVVRPKALGDYDTREFRMLIDGQWVDGAEGRTIERVAPGHGVVVSAIRRRRKRMPNGRSPPHGALSTKVHGRA